MNITGWILGALPSGLLPGIVIGIVLTALIGGAVAYVAAFLLRHYRLILLCCAVVGAVGILLLAI